MSTSDVCLFILRNLLKQIQTGLYLNLRVRRTIELFLEGMWRSGALVGGSPADAFFIDIGPNTMTKDDIDNGRLVCVIGVAPVKPAEFVIFRITQKTGE